LAFARFSQDNRGRNQYQMRKFPAETMKIPVQRGVSRKTREGTCTKSGHRLVDRLHSIEKTCLTDAGF